MKKHLFTCITCNQSLETSDSEQYLCPSCSRHNTTVAPPAGILKTLYDYESLQKRNLTFHDLQNRGFIDLLPIEDLKSLPPLHIGKTPLYVFDELDGKSLPFHLHIKDDTQNPTLSYKDRASALVSAYARENGKDTIVTASTGNAGSSLAGICASQRQRAVVMVPATAPQAKISQIMMYGAQIVPVKGSYDEAFDLSVEATATYGWYNRNTGYNPLTVEGKKTAAFELYDQMNGNLPDRIFISVGDGVIISGIYKGFEDLYKLGLIEKLPVMVAVQASTSSNLVRNIGHDDFRSETSDTIADSISVDIPRNFFMAKQYLQSYGGEWITVTDDEILSASASMAANTGIFGEPAAAAAFAGFLAYHREGKCHEGSHNVVMVTGSGLKDLKAIEKTVQPPEPISPDLSSLHKLLQNDKKR